MIRDIVLTIVMDKRWDQRADWERQPDTQMWVPVSIHAWSPHSAMKSFLPTLSHSICCFPRDFLCLTSKRTGFGVMCWFKLDLAVFDLCDLGQVIQPLWASCTQHLHPPVVVKTKWDAKHDRVEHNECKWNTFKLAKVLFSVLRWHSECIQPYIFRQHFMYLSPISSGL